MHFQTWHRSTVLCNTAFGGGGGGGGGGGVGGIEHGLGASVQFINSVQHVKVQHSVHCCPSWCGLSAVESYTEIFICSACGCSVVCMSPPLSLSLCVCVCPQFKGAVQLLLDHGSDVWLKNSAGKTAAEEVHTRSEVRRCKW